MNNELMTNLLLLPAARNLFYSYAFGILTKGFLVAASGSNSKAPRARQWGSINQNVLIMQNEPNFSKSQMIITLLKTTNYSEKCTLDTWSKRTQNEPNRTQFQKAA
jgi:hypothetical protein